MKQAMSQSQSRTGALAQLDSMQKQGSSPLPASLKLSSPLRKDIEMDDGSLPKRSVLAKVKEKAKKWRHSLSKKKFNEVSIPSWGVSLEDEDEDEDPEYLGAPMYESETAPERYRETARQHPRANPVIPENHVLPNGINCGSEQKSPSNCKAVNESLPMKEEEKYSMTETETTTRSLEEETCPKMESENMHGKQGEGNSQKSLTRTLTEKLAPAYATVSDTSNAIASKLQNLFVSIPGLANSAAASDEPGSAPAMLDQKISSSPSMPAASHEYARATSQIWDRGVSMKDFILQKLAPGEDEKALSEVISEAMSPRKSPRDAGVVEKMKEAVSSMLWNEEASQTAQLAKSSQPASCHSHNNSASHIPVSTSAHQVAEEDNQESNGRRLQPN